MQATIIDIIAETADIKSFKIQPETTIPFTPGQWMYVRLTSELKHHFTISASPTEDALMFTTKKTESEYKNELWRKKIGDVIEINGAFGSFTLDVNDSSPRIFVAGGIGITPYRSMIKYIEDKQLGLPYTLLYSFKSKDEVCFKALFENNPQVKIVETSTQGRLDEQKIKLLCPDWESSSLWLCGPPALVEAFVEIGQKMGIKPERIKSEEFTGY